MESLDRITHVPGVMGGKATIRGMRVTVGMILGQLSAGQTVDGLLDDYPYLETRGHSPGHRLRRSSGA